MEDEETHYITQFISNFSMGAGGNKPVRLCMTVLHNIRVILNPNDEVNCPICEKKMVEMVVRKLK